MNAQCPAIVPDFGQWYQRHYWTSYYSSYRNEAISLDCDMGKPKKANDFFKTPNYRGGNAAIKKYVTENLKYPKEAFEAKIEGTVEVAYVVDGLGKVIDAQVKTGIGHGCDEEALRLVRGLVFEKAINRGFKTNSKRNIKIHFKLPKMKRKPTTTQISYQVVSSKPKPAPAPKPKKSGYNITLNITKR
ncbi:MAG: energy transducer TonB [Bacteroidota bacterium]